MAYDNNGLNDYKKISKMTSYCQNELNDKQKILNILEKHGCTRREFAHIPLAYQEDIDIVIKAIEKNAVILQLIAPSLFKNINFIKKIVNADLNDMQKNIFFMNSHDIINKNEDVLLDLFKKYGDRYMYYFSSFKSKFKNDRVFILKLIKNKYCNYEMCEWILTNCIFENNDEKIHANDDDEIVKEILNYCYCDTFRYISSRLKNSFDFIKMALEKNAEAIIYIPREFHGKLKEQELLDVLRNIKSKYIANVILCKSNIKNNIFYNVYSKNKEIMMLLIDKDPMLYCLLSDNLKKIKNEYYSLSNNRIYNNKFIYKNNDLYKDEDILNVLFKDRKNNTNNKCEYVNYINYTILPPEFYSNINIVTRYSISHPKLYIDASPLITSDISLARKLLKENGSLIKFSSFNIRNNKELALLAVSSCPHAYGYINKELKYDDDIVFLTIKGDAFMYDFLPYKMKKILKYKLAYDIALKKHEIQAKDTTIKKNEINSINIELLTEEINNHNDLNMDVEDFEHITYLMECSDPDSETETDSNFSDDYI